MPAAEPDGLRVAVDLHGTLDEGSPTGVITRRSKEAYRALLRVGLVPWILSFIGPNPELRAKAEQQRVELARFLGLPTELPEGPTTQGVYLLVCSKRVSTQSDPNSGKPYECLVRNCTLLIDDRVVICEACERAGVLAYQANRNALTRRRDQYRAQLPFAHGPSPDLATAVERLLADRASGRLDQKLAFVWEKRKG